MSDRNLGDVIDQCLKIIPESELSFRQDLESIAESFRYTAPECIPDRWVQVTECLEEHLPGPESLKGWQVQIVEMYTQRSFKTLGEG